MPIALRIILYFIAPVAFFWVVKALLPAIVRSSRETFDKSHWRSFKIGLVYVAALLALFELLITLTRSTGLDFLFILPLLLALVFAYGVVLGLTAVTQSLGARIFPEHSANRHIIYGTIVALVAGLAPILGWTVLFPYLLISGFGGVAISYNEMRKAKK